MSESYEELDFDQADKLIKKRQRFARRPKRSAELVARLLARKGYGQQQSTDQLNEAWNVVVNEKWRSQTRVGSIRRGVLEVMVASSVVNQQLEFEKRNLVNGLKKQIPQAEIRDIRFRIGNTGN